MKYNAEAMVDYNYGKEQAVIMKSDLISDTHLVALIQFLDLQIGFFLELEGSYSIVAQGLIIERQKFKSRASGRGLVT